MFENALRRLRDLQRKAELLDGEHSVPLGELFPDEFMLRNSDFPSLEAMFNASGFKIDSADDFAAIPDADWDTFVSNRTLFQSWEDMMAAAAQEWAARRLELD